MLREVRSARFVERHTLLGRRYALPLRDGAEVVWRRRAFRALLAAAAREPVALAEDGDRTWWCSEGRLLWTDEDLAARDVLALVRDGGRCVACGAAFDLQYDHVIPLALGGADSAENLQVLCAPCNQAKGTAVG